MPRFFVDEGKLRSLRSNGERLIGTELLFLPSERGRAAAETLADLAIVERICLDFWQPTLDALTRV